MNVELSVDRPFTDNPVHKSTYDEERGSARAQSTDIRGSVANPKRQSSMMDGVLSVISVELRNHDK